MTQCPCDLDRSYDECCGRLHRGAKAMTTVEVMRARYSAYVLGLERYLLATWDSETRPTEPISFPDAQRWIGLTVGNHQGGPFDQTGSVAFTAEYQVDGATRYLVEHSRFRRFEGGWVYVDAIAARIEDDLAALGPLDVRLPDIGSETPERS